MIVLGCVPKVKYNYYGGVWGWTSAHVYRGGYKSYLYMYEQGSLRQLKRLSFDDTTFLHILLYM